MPESNHGKIPWLGEIGNEISGLSLCNFCTCWRKTIILVWNNADPIDPHPPTGHPVSLVLQGFGGDFLPTPAGVNALVEGIKLPVDAFPQF